MRIEFFGLTFDTPCVTFYLWSPWRAAALEHRLFEADFRPEWEVTAPLPATAGDYLAELLANLVL